MLRTLAKIYIYFKFAFAFSVYDIMNYPKVLMGDTYENEIGFALDNNVPFYEYHKERPFASNRIRRGIVDECCFSPCTDRVLLSYCGTDHD